MKAQHQTTFGTKKEGDDRELGNCFATAIACILNLNVEDVPNFILHKDWFQKTNEWLNERGYCYLEFSLGEEREFWAHFTGYCVLVGDGPRGCKHAVVGYKGEFHHDPHPSGQGLLSTELIGFLIPIEPTVVSANR